ncbi:MAG: sugar phosphate isomerase/epimerase [Clostridia bacterium]|nr:sugar phosphate isomerase/epimerase [Clostridia bacterium]
MATFILSAFADEASPHLEEQLRALRDEGIGLIELRGVDGRNCSVLTPEEADAVKARLDAAGVRLSALGSPFGKYPLTAPFEKHLMDFRHGLRLCRQLGCDRMRVFSFYPPEGDDPAAWRDAVFARMAVMLEEAAAAGVTLCHENEKGVYGDTPARCRELLDRFPDLGCVFDPANFVQCGAHPLEAWAMLRDRVTYMHIKDALREDGAVVAPGHGDGCLAEILAALNAQTTGEIVLTVEPHLTVFDGLRGLQTETLRHREAYPDARTAFHAACGALKEMLRVL